MISTELLAKAYGTEEDLLLKEAGALDIAGRLAAAVVLLQLIDSQKNHHAQAEHAKQQVTPTIQSLESRPPQHMAPYPRHEVASHSDFRRGPQMFVAAESPYGVESDVERERYRMGFVRNVPAGMDAGMVRLASDETAMSELEEAQAKLAAGMLSNLAAGAKNMASNLRKRTQNAAGKAWTAVSGAPAVPPMPIPPPLNPPPNPMVKVPFNRKAPNTFPNYGTPNYRTAPAAPVPPVAAPAARPAPAAAASPRYKPENVQNINKDMKERSGSVIPGLTLLGVGAGIAATAPRAMGKVLDYADKEQGATPWGMSPYGAVRPNHVVNEHGQAMPG